MTLKNALSCLGLLCVMALSTWVFSEYFRWQPQPLVWFVSFALSALASWRRPFRQVGTKTLAVIGAFTLLFDLSLVLGYHIVTNASYYFGQAWDNYITPYSGWDALAFAAMFPALYIVALAPCTFSESKKSAERNSSHTVLANRDGIETDRFDMSRTWLFGGAVSLFIAWTPYLLTYWPGLVFGDTLDSIRQVLGMSDWNNHFPIAYTAFIAFCFRISQILGWGNTGGCAIYTILQMLFMAYCFSYAAQWVTSRGRLHWAWSVIVLLFFGLTPFIAIYSIAMWKDPVFSVSIMVLSMMLLDFIWTNGRIVHARKLWIAEFVFLLIIVSFFRSNGLIITIFLAVLFFAVFIRKPGAFESGAVKPVVIASTLTVVAALICAGPLVSLLHINRYESVEGTGILYNQMARVAVYQGAMSEDDREYLDSILPFDKYPEVYRPCCVDMLKTDEDFKSGGIASLLKHWPSMLLKNPQLYAESWELQTFGFWVVNDPNICSFNNISYGAPRNASPEERASLEKPYDIHASPVLPGDEAMWQSIFPEDSWTPPAALFFWLALYLLCLCIAFKRTSWSLALLPSLLLFFSMFIATPIAYWPRYVAAAYFLIPFYIFLLYALICLGNQEATLSGGTAPKLS